MVPLLFLIIFGDYLPVPSNLSTFGGSSIFSYLSKDGALFNLYRETERISSFLSRVIGSVSTIGVLLNYLLGVLGVGGFRKVVFIY